MLEIQLPFPRHKGKLHCPKGSEIAFLSQLREVHYDFLTQFDPSLTSKKSNPGTFFISRIETFEGYDTETCVSFLTKTDNESQSVFTTGNDGRPKRLLGKIDRDIKVRRILSRHLVNPVRIWNGTTHVEVTPTRWWGYLVQAWFMPKALVIGVGEYPEMAEVDCEFLRAASKTKEELGLLSSFEGFETVELETEVRENHSFGVIEYNAMDQYDPSVSHENDNAFWVTHETVRRLIHMVDNSALSVMSGTHESMEFVTRMLVMLGQNLLKSNQVPDSFRMEPETYLSLGKRRCREPRIEYTSLRVPRADVFGIAFDRWRASGFVEPLAGMKVLEELKATLLVSSLSRQLN